MARIISFNVLPVEEIDEIEDFVQKNLSVFLKPDLSFVEGFEYIILPPNAPSVNQPGKIQSIINSLIFKFI
jgi:hypothetical protein